MIYYLNHCDRSTSSICATVVGNSAGQLSAKLEAAHSWAFSHHTRTHMRHVSARETRAHGGADCGCFLGWCRCAIVVGRVVCAGVVRACSSRAWGLRAAGQLQRTAAAHTDSIADSAGACTHGGARGAAGEEDVLEGGERDAEAGERGGAGAEKVTKAMMWTCSCYEGTRQRPSGWPAH